MQPMNDRAARVLNTLVEGLAPGEAKKVDNAGGAIMAVHVDRLTEATFAIAHRFTMNGDSCADPDMVFHRDEDGRWRPVTFQQDVPPRFVEALVLDGNNNPKGVRVRAYKELRSFASLWLKNIASQQRLHPVRTRTVRTVVEETEVPR